MLTIEEIDHTTQGAISRTAKTRKVLRAAASHAPRSLSKIGAVQQRLDKPRDLSRISRPVRVEHDNDVPSSGGEATRQCIPLPARGLKHNARCGPQVTGDVDRVVGRVAINDDDLVDPVRDFREDVREVRGLIERGYDDADTRCAETGGLMVSARRNEALELCLGACFVLT